MKNLYKLFLLCWLLLPVLTFSQGKYMTSKKYTFSGGNNGSLGGNAASDVVVTFNSIDGNMDVAVKKVTASWSVLIDYMGNCWTDRIIFNQNNRYIEFRMKASAPFKATVGAWGGMDACKPQLKTWTPSPFSINESDVWQIVWVTVPATTGGSQNLIDTIGNGIAWTLPDGNYNFDYVMYGDAAKPVNPIIDQVKDKNVGDCGKPITINLTGIEIPTRLYDGLTISAESKSDGFIKDVTIMDLGGGIYIDETNKAASLQFTPIVGMQGMSDSIIVTLRDTIRGAVKKMAFKVNILKCTDGIENVINDVQILPTVVDDVVTIKFSELTSTNVIIVNQIGVVVKTLDVKSSTEEQINVSELKTGFYYIKFSDGTTKKIVKL